MNYTIPTNLLNTKNAKTIKGEKRGWTTYVMYLSPFKGNSKGVNLCPKASKGCAKACLFSSGAARFSNVQNGKINKTEYFLADMKGFMAQLDGEIAKIKNKHFKKGDNHFAIRLNGTSDFRFENIKLEGGKNIFQLHPDVQFYDYTKIPQRMGGMPKNYHLTFSRSEENHDEVVDVLNGGGNVAVVFENELPETYLGYKVIDGDQDDLRFLDEENVVVGLKYKKASVMGGKKINDEAIESGFVISQEELETKLGNLRVA